MDKLRVLAVGAHPDDIELLCAGTLAKFARKGNKVFIIHLCNGDLGGKGISRQKLARIRKAEAKESGALIGAKVLGPICSDLGTFLNKDNVHKLIELVRQVMPDIIITHSPDDYMSDHVNTSRLVFEASFGATVPNYKTRSKAHELIVPVFYMDTLAGINFLPTDYVDITKEWEIKKEMFLCHRSQHGWLKGHHKADATELMEAMARFRGIQCGVKFAEGFRKMDVWGRLRPERLLP
jgi:LmbE family N-acetylglucosaminyl deacetylase